MTTRRLLKHMTEHGPSFLVEALGGETFPIEESLRRGDVRLARDPHRRLPSGEVHDMYYVVLCVNPVGLEMIEYLPAHLAEEIAARARVDISYENDPPYEGVSHAIQEPVHVSLSQFNGLPFLEDLKPGEAKEGWWARKRGDFDSIFILYGEGWVEKSIEYPEAA